MEYYSKYIFSLILYIQFFSNVTCKWNVLDLQFFLLIPKKEMNLANMKCLNKNNIFFLKYYFLMSFLMKFLLFCSYLTLALNAPTNATCLYSSNTCLLTAKPREEQMSLISLLSFSSSTQTPHFHLSTFFKETWCCNSLLRNRNILKQSNMNSPFGSKPGSHCAILAMIWSSETNFENPKRFL